MEEIPAYGAALVFLLTGIGFVAAGMISSALLAPQRPNSEKLATYECGEEPQGTAWGQFNFRFYVMGLIFLVFDVEILLLFPWATIFADTDLIRHAPAWGVFNLAETGIFFLILAAGLAYVWNRNAIDWSRPKTETANIPTGVPTERYIQLNKKLQSRDGVMKSAEISADSVQN